MQPAARHVMVPACAAAAAAAAAAPASLPAGSVSSCTMPMLTSHLSGAQHAPQKATISPGIPALDPGPSQPIPMKGKN